MRHVFVLFDESGSMGDFAITIRAAMQSLHEAKPSDCRMGFIGFSDYAIYGDTVSSVMSQNGSTNIACAFELLQKKLQSLPEATDVSVVFISDGCDSFESRCLERLRALRVPAAPCVLFCVGVGSLFPTSLAVEHLRPLYHSAGTDAWPAVIPLDTVEETFTVFTELERLLFRRESEIQEFHEGTGIRDLITGCGQVYNKAVNRCALVKSSEFVIDTLTQAIERLRHIQGLARKLETSTSAVDTSFLPLASNLLQAAVFNTKVCVRQAETMISQLYQMIRRAEGDGLMFHACTDAEKQKVLSYGHVVGRHTKAAHAHHSAQYSVSKNTLRGFLSQYTPSEHDEALEDKINWCSQATYFEDARLHLNDIMTNIPTLVHMMEFVPIVCRTLTLKLPLPQGLQMNPWLGKIEGMPTIITHMTTYDFFERFNKKKSSHGEVINGIMLVTKDPSGSILSRGIGKHLSSYLLTRNSDLYFPDADLATWAMVAVYILSQDTQPAWMADELETLKIMNKAVYSLDGSWTKYLDVVASKSFRQALSNNCDDLPKFCGCPHLNKFILATMFRADELSSADIENRRSAALMEFFGRASFSQLSELFDGTFTVKPDDILDDIHPEMLCTAYETVRCFRAKLRLVFMEKFSMRYKRQSVLQWPTKLVENIRVRNFSVWNLSPRAIDQIFTSIGRMRGFELRAIEDDEWASLALTGFSIKSSLGRSQCDKLINHTDAWRQIESNLVEKFFSQIHKQSESYVMKLFHERMQRTHQGLPVLITANFAEKFKEKHGRDLMAELDVCEYGLSRNACMHPSCPFFAKPLGKKARSRDGKPRMCDRLRQHLGPLCAIKGLHRMVITRPELESVAIVEQTLSQLPIESLVAHEVHSLLQSVREIRQPVEWEAFEALLMGASP
jgi:hypothetical protein